VEQLGHHHSPEHPTAVTATPARATRPTPAPCGSCSAAGSAPPGPAPNRTERPHRTLEVEESGGGPGRAPGGVDHVPTTKVSIRSRPGQPYRCRGSMGEDHL